MKKVFFSSFVILLLCASVNAQTPGDSSPYLVRQTISSAGTSTEITVSGIEYLIQESIGQSSPIGSLQLSENNVIQGFIQPSVLSKILTPIIPLGLMVNVFPNPFIDIITIQFDQLPSSEVRISVFDILGSEISQRSFTSQMQLSIELFGLTSGYYFLKIESNNSQHIEKILKSK